MTATKLLIEKHLEVKYMKTVQTLDNTTSDNDAIMQLIGEKSVDEEYISLYDMAFLEAANEY